MYRIIDKEGKEGPWTPYILDEIPATKETGEYIPQLASFTNLEYQQKNLKDRIEFQAKQRPNPRDSFSIVPRSDGGGRFDFETAKLRKQGPEGKDAELEIGDKIEYFVEVMDRNPAPGRQPGRSEPPQGHQVGGRCSTSCSG